MHSVTPMCVLQKDHRLSVFAVLKLRLYQVCTASAVKSFRIFLVSGFCTRANAAGYHLPCSGATFRTHDKHSKILLMLEEKGTRRKTHAFCFCRQDCDEQINCSFFVFY